MQRPGRRWLVGSGIYVALTALLATIAFTANATWAWLSLIGILLPFGYFLIYPIYLLASAVTPGLSATLITYSVGVLGYASAAALNAFLIWSIASGLRRRWASRR